MYTNTPNMYTNRPPGVHKYAGIWTIVYTK
nr:MAG TPA: hypothetical protein [Caudoviricetes sp.]